MKKALATLVVCLFLCSILSVSSVKPAKSDASNDHRREILVDNSGNPETLTNYQVFLNVSYDPSMHSDFGDLRFTWLNRTSSLEVNLDLWLDLYVDSEYALIWVEVPSIGGLESETLYMYYGDPDAASESDGEETFVFFDDFSTDTTSNYDIVKGTGAFSWKPEEELLEIDDVQGSYIWIRQKNELLDMTENKYWLETRAKISGSGLPDMFAVFKFYDYTGDHSTAGDYYMQTAMLRDTPSRPPPEGRHFELASWWGDPRESNNYKYLLWYNDVYYRWSLGTAPDGTVHATLFDDLYKPIESLVCQTIHQNTDWWPGIGHNMAGGTGEGLTSYWDYTRIRKFTDPEPTYIIGPSWEYVFEDSCRGTTLKISTDDQHFQFITPDKEFTIKHDSNMRVWECRCTTSIFICYADDEITLTAIAFDGRYKVCMAFAKDMQTGKSYVLVDKPRWPGFHGRCYAK